ncbi:MAG: iron ABC transporter permease [Treponema sp.]|nr:iron ABC transporter permease [Treponema sp.]
MQVLLAATPKDFKAVFSQNIWHQIIFNTILECVCSAFISVVVGYLFAYAVVKADIPAKKFFSVLPLVHLVTPPFVGGLAFILLFGRQGFITHTVLGLNLSLYGFWGLLIAQVLCFFPMAYLICAQTLRGINTNFEKAARSMGASELKIFLTITLPLSFPGILSSFLFIAVSVLSDFGNPLIVGGRFRVLAVEIYTQLTGWLNVGTSAVLGIVLIIPSVIFFVLQNKVNKKIEERTAGISQKSEFEKSSCPLFAKIILTTFVTVISIFILAQGASIVAGSFQKLWGINKAFTFNHIKHTVQYTRELKNSVGFALISAMISTVIASVSSYIVHRTDVPLKKTLDIFAQIPSAIPGSLLGLAISLSANTLKFRNSNVLIVVAMTVAFMPFAYRVISNTYGQIKYTLDDAARSLGANQLFTLFTVIAPVSKGGIFSGFIYDFIRGVGTLSAVIFLVSFKTPLASIELINLAEQGNWGSSCALALCLTLITFLILGSGLFINMMISKKREKINGISFFK